MGRVRNVAMGGMILDQNLLASSWAHPQGWGWEWGYADGQSKVFGRQQALFQKKIRVICYGLEDKVHMKFLRQ